MTGAARNLLAGAGTLVVGLGLWLFADGVDLPVVTPAKVGVVMMCVGGAEVLLGLYRAVRASAGSG
ncbi:MULTISPECIES: DUF5708 family protein [Streptomyces]|jgi:hypothetical protein|uniref:Uncharacterized protein n=2 Tax=Streptomyces TaxID=1883 RepID=A0A514JNW5_9ACTN|nr:DUF5708 family protein [Streptomyces calvus]MBA8947087.1 hypothetical protein [Streptomyces calvus]MBA8974776.1 hypothetical protein [Streptomyces calvus]QDI69029.1 hypothetical protein CD934_10200 [Streptomyces calvus]GGP74010.1 hypothetical protein GCM10010247_54020 [Streptomyces calvus]